MSKSIGLALYLIAATRNADKGGHPAELPDPPAGRDRVWMHVPGPESLRPLMALADRLHALRPSLGLILTHPPGAQPPPGALPPPCLKHPTLPEDPAVIHTAFTRWAPSALVLGDDALPPALIHEAGTAGVPVFLVNARAPRVDGSWRAWPGLQRTLLRRMRRILVHDAAALAAMRRAGAPAARLEATGPMAEGHGALPCNMAERDAMARSLGVRPVWLAVAVPQEEEDAVLDAHRTAQSLAPRLLLLLVPADPARGEALSEKARALGLRAARRAAEEEPGDDDQIYVADTEEELGLWYRLAPITFMGGTLAGEGGRRDPYEAAALGSAIVHGPETAPHEDAYARLIRARALRRVSGSAALAEAVIELLAPDRAAAMAHAAWSVSTLGAEATDRAAELVLEAVAEQRR